MAQVVDSGLYQQSDGKWVFFILAEGIQNMLNKTLIHRDY